MVQYEYDDGGREAAGFTGKTGDCVTRAIAIASGLPYREVYDAINVEAKRERGEKRSSAREGVKSATTRRYLEKIGAVWTPTMFVGQGCKVHVRADELPAEGRHVLNLSKHLAAYVDGVLRDTHRCDRDGTRCVYGYWTF